MALLNYASRLSITYKSYFNIAKLCLRTKNTSSDVTLPNVKVSMPSMVHILSQNSIPEKDRLLIDKEINEMLEDWLPYTEDILEKDDDKFLFNLVTFTLFPAFLGLLCFSLWYYPDRGNVNWAKTEAMLEIERRAKNGLPLVDPNLIPVSQIKLPTDEELGPDFKIII